MAKLLILLFIVAAVWWLVSPRRSLRGGTGRGRTPPPQAMVACAHCGVHLPRNEAVAGRDGLLYCDAGHRLAHERGEPRHD